MTFEQVRNSKEINTLLQLSDRQLSVMGFSEHSFRHAGIVCERVKYILQSINAPADEIELGLIAAYIHDLGNSINRNDHAQSGAMLAYSILVRNGMDVSDAAEVMMAIGNHDEKTGRAVSTISAALILSDKSDVHRSRVRQNKVVVDIDQLKSRDIHDRVNYAVETSEMLLDMQKKEITFQFKIDTTICSTMDYFEIFLGRMNMCKGAAAYLGLGFRLIINGFSLI